MRTRFGLLRMAVVVIAVLCSCSEDLSFVEETETRVPRPSVKVNATISGLVLDEMEMVIKDAEVSIDNKSTQTDENGYFQLQGLYDQANTFITVKKEGYFDAHGTVMPTEDGVMQVKFVLSAKDDPATGDAQSDLTVSDSDYDLIFEGGGFTQADEPYSGEVSIFSRYIDPSDDGDLLKIPGTMLSRDDNILQLISPLAIIDVDLRSASAGMLNINRPATISTRIPSSLQTSAPDEIPLWHLNVDTGLWEDRGVASRSGDRYIATVSSFSTWCMGVAWDVVEVSGQITRDGIGYPFARHRAGGGAVSYQADQNGNYNRLVVEDRPFDFVILDACRTVVHRESVPALSEDTELDIEVSFTPNSIELSGTLLDCKGDPLTEGYTLINFPGNNFFEVIPTSSDGSYRFLYEDCSADAVILKGYDLANDLTSSPTEVTTSGTYDLYTCEALGDQQLIIEIEGQAPYVMNSCVVTVEDNSSGTLIGKKYTFRVIDTFTDVSGGDGESVVYVWIITLFDNEGVPPLIGQNPLPISSDNPPVEWLLQFDIQEPYILNEEGGFVDLTIGVVEQFSAKIVSGESQELGGMTTMRFIAEIQ